MDKLNPQKITYPCYGEVIKINNNEYCIGNEIAHGAFGVVYECNDVWKNELVAKVILPSGRSYENVKQKWLDELRNLLSLRHPNITFVHAAFEYKDTFYLVIERCANTINDLIKSRNFKGELWLIPIARCILQAINFIHNMGYVHKDIHPGNVFTSFLKDELVPSQYSAITFKIGDLGISRLKSDIDIFGTILAKWMLPPEYLNPNEFGNIDERVDIYHAGLLFLYILQGNIIEFTEDEIISGKPKYLAENLKPPFNKALSKALRRHVQYRTPTAIEFWNDLNLVNT